MTETPDHRFVRLVGDHDDVLVRAARLLCGDWTHAEELLQHALARILTHWDSSRSDTEVAVRARQELVATYLDDVCEPADPNPQPGGPLLDGLGELPPVLRAAVVARYYLCLTDQQTAEVLHVDAGQVSDLAARCLAWLGGRWDQACCARAH